MGKALIKCLQAQVYILCTHQHTLYAFWHIHVFWTVLEEVVTSLFCVCQF